MHDEQELKNSDTNGDRNDGNRNGDGNDGNRNGDGNDGDRNDGDRNGESRTATQEQRQSNVFSFTTPTETDNQNKIFPTATGNKTTYFTNGK